MRRSPLNAFAVVGAIACADPPTAPVNSRLEIGFLRYEPGAYWSDLYLTSLDGTQTLRLTTVKSLALIRPRWSPDGTKIAFTVFTTPQGGNGVQVANADGSDRYMVASGSAPAWSPDGAQIGFTGKYSFIYPGTIARVESDQIYITVADGIPRTRLEQDSTSQNVMGSWRPDGGEIVFSSFNSQRHGWEIFVMNADGTNPRRLTENADTDTDPDWSPTGAKIVFVRRVFGANAAIYTMNPDGSDEQRLTTNASDDTCPSWSPDGNRIAFTSNRDGFRQTYLMNADGTAQTRLATDFDDACPAWRAR